MHAVDGGNTGVDDLNSEKKVRNRGEFWKKWFSWFFAYEKILDFSWTSTICKIDRENKVCKNLQFFMSTLSENVEK